MRNFLDLALKGKNNSWRYLLGIMFIFFVFYGYGLIIPEEVEFWGPIANYIIQDFSFVLIILATFFVVKFLHKRPVMSLLTPRRAINWKLILVGFLLFFGLMFLLSFIPQYILDPSSMTLNPDIFGFLLFLPFLLLMVPIQTTSEEIFYRGYILQGTGFLSRNFLLLAILNGVLFMIPHLANPEVAATPLAAILDYIVFGFIMAYITLKSGTLELAIAGHAANNLFISLLANYEDSVFTTPSLFMSSTSSLESVDDTVFILATIMTSVVIPALYYILMFKIPKLKVYMNLDS